MDVALALAASLLGLVVLLLAVPVGLAFRLEGIEPVAGRVDVRWLFGLVRFRVPMHEEKKAGEGREKRKAGREKGRGRRKRRRGGRRALAVLGQEAFRRRVRRLLGDLLRALHPRDLRLWLRLGLGDPADTGRLWAVLGPLSAVARGLERAEVRIEPEFQDPVLELRARGEIRVVPLRILALAVAFALSPPSLRAWHTLWVRHA